MKKDEIKGLIQKYHIVDCRNGNLRVPSNLSHSDLEQVKAAKAEILEYFEAERAEAARAAAREAEVFESIPGLTRLRDARMRWAEWNREFNRRMEDEMLSSVLPAAPTDDLDALEKAYPEAVFALKVDRERNGANYDIVAIASRAYRDIVSGVPVPECKARYDAAMRDFRKRKMWD